MDKLARYEVGYTNNDDGIWLYRLDSPQEIHLGFIPTVRDILNAIERGTHDRV